MTQHLKEKRTNIQLILHVCIYTTKNEILSQIKIRTLIKLYHKTILPALLYGCETWYINREDIKELTDIQFTIIRTILKLPISTPKPALLGEIGEFPIELNIEERKLMYLHKAFTSKTRINDISHIQIEKYNNNRENIINHNITFLEKYNINEIKETISLMAKSKWKKIVKTKIEEKANEIYKNECEKLKKLKCLNQYKAKIKRERYMDILQQERVRVLFKVRTQMISVRNNFKNKYEDLMCPKCKKEIDDEKHLFTKCEKLADIQKKYNINDPKKVFNEGLFKERMIKIAKFIDKTEIENKI